MEQVAKKIILFILFSSCLTPAFAFTDKRLASFKEAEQFYGKGKYHFAILKYQSFIFFVKDKEELKTYLDESQYKLSMSCLKINATKNATLNLARYLKDYPAGKHIKEVELALKELVVENELPKVTPMSDRGDCEKAEKVRSYSVSVDPENKSAKESQPKAQKLVEEANIPSSIHISKDNHAAARFKTLLKQLSAKYHEKPERIDDTTRSVVALLKEKGIAETPLRIMEGLNTLPSFPPLSGSSRYANCAILYAAFRYEGDSHEESIYCIQEGIMRLRKATHK